MTGSVASDPGTRASSGGSVVAFRVHWNVQHLEAASLALNPNARPVLAGHVGDAFVAAGCGVPDLAPEAAQCVGDFRVARVCADYLVACG